MNWLNWSYSMKCKFWYSVSQRRSYFLFFVFLALLLILLLMILCKCTKKKGDYISFGQYLFLPIHTALGLQIKDIVKLGIAIACEYFCDKTMDSRKWNDSYHRQPHFQRVTICHGYKVLTLHICSDASERYHSRACGSGSFIMRLMCDHVRLWTRVFVISELRKHK